MLNVCEIFRSIQGESSRAGAVCTFVRLTGCNLSCTYCDTAYARGEGRFFSVDQIVAAVAEKRCKLVEITGGEPLLQAETPTLCARLQEHGYTVMIETNGSLDISQLPPGCIRIVDIKTPGSGAGDSFLPRNITALEAEDECKIVLTSRADFEWACRFVRRHGLCDIATVIFSPAEGYLPAGDLAEWILADDLPVRLGIQLHKVIWGDECRGR